MKNVLTTTVNKAVQYGKELLEGLIQKSVPVRAGPKIRGFGGERGQGDLVKHVRQPPTLLSNQRGLISNYLKKYSSNGLASELGRNAARQMWTGAAKGSVSRLRYVSRRMAMYGFVGVSLVGSSQRQEEFDPLPICKHISELFSAIDYDSLQAPPMGKNVEDYQFGHLIATGCDAAVYEAQPTLNLSLSSSTESLVSDASFDAQPASFDMIPESGEPSFEVIAESGASSIGSEDGFDVISDGESFSEDSLSSAGHSVLQDKVGIKVMFNYGAESTAAAIEQAMERELVPMTAGPDSQPDRDHLCGAHVKKKRLPSHPNIARLYGCFVDRLPLLEAAHCMYPMALPPRLNAEGYGRNSTLFIVMKRYDCNLGEYLHERGPCEGREGTLLLLQLVNAIQHMQKHHVAHRDLKSDNLLMNLSDPSTPGLVVSDFGHCLVGDVKTWGLRLPYVSHCMDKGGNGKLMAPEISTAIAGCTSHLDFRSSDLWAAGTLAYEIFAGANPFYTDLFDSRSYTEAELPRLPAEVPHQVAGAVYNMLARDPQQRLPCGVISHLLSLVLWAPPSWQHQPPCPVTTLRWLVSLAAQGIIRPGADDIQQQQLQVFLGNLDWGQLERAMKMFCD